MAGTLSDDREVAKLLKTCRRTLQEYRDAGRMSYIQLGGKILYRESDIERLLMEGYRRHSVSEPEKDMGKM